MPKRRQSFNEKKGKKMDSYLLNAGLTFYTTK